MVSKSRKFFIGVLFTTVFIGELSFQISTNEESSIVNLAKQEQVELDAVLKQDEVKKSYLDAQARVLPIQNAKAIYDTLNSRASRRKDLFSPYSEMIVNADRQLDAAWKPYNDKVEKYQAPIRETYKLRRQAGQNLISRLSGIQYGVSASILAAGLAFFSTLVGGSWKCTLFGMSFIAQATACTNIWHGALLRYNSEIQAWAFAVMFLTCAPLAFHWGTILFKIEMVEFVKKEKHLEKARPSAESGGTLSVTESHQRTVSFTVWGKNADGFLKFVEFLKNEKANKNGVGLQADGARYFGIKSAQITRALGQAREGKTVTVPTVLTLPLPVRTEMSRT